ncbi:hypothetical protein MycrhDRAFT_1560 [Mycolicibacterium rhodesiae JS60]|nr:hypothetical protein MycrhDRAFT_1560 [Mycolicibacterium rhodesiae JS60]
MKPKPDNQYESTPRPVAAALDHVADVYLPDSDGRGIGPGSG